MMGIYTTKPFVTFTDHGFPKELIDELEKRTGRKIIGNKAASGTEILDELAERVPYIVKACSYQILYIFGSRYLKRFFHGICCFIIYAAKIG